MRDIRITLRGEDFAAVSQSMIKLGVTFQVEPVEIEEASPAVGVVAPPRSKPAKRKATRTKPSGTAAKPAATRATGNDATGADRLRAMVERNRLASSRPAESETNTETGEAGGEGNG